MSSMALGHVGRGIAAAARRGPGVSGSGSVLSPASAGARQLHYNQDGAPVIGTKQDTNDPEYKVRKVPNN